MKYAYTTQDEIDFIAGLEQSRKTRYCQMLLNTPRRWDPDVDVEVVMATARMVLRGGVAQW